VTNLVSQPRSVNRPNELWTAAGYDAGIAPGTVQAMPA